jgi:hypothetical protein
LPPGRSSKPDLTPEEEAGSQILRRGSAMLTTTSGRTTSLSGRSLRPELEGGEEAATREAEGAREATGPGGGKEEDATP